MLRRNAFQRGGELLAANLRRAHAENDRGPTGAAQWPQLTQLQTSESHYNFFSLNAEPFVKRTSACNIRQCLRIAGFISPRLLEMRVSQTQRVWDRWLGEIVSAAPGKCRPKTPVRDTGS